MPQVRYAVVLQTSAADQRPSSTLPQVRQFVLEMAERGRVGEMQSFGPLMFIGSFFLLMLIVAAFEDVRDYSQFRWQEYSS